MALRLIVERESEIEKFKSDEYWDVEGAVTTPEGATLKAALTHLEGEKLAKLSLSSEQQAEHSCGDLHSSIMACI